MLSIYLGMLHVRFDVKNIDNEKVFKKAPQNRQKILPMLLAGTNWAKSMLNKAKKNHDGSHHTTQLSDSTVLLIACIIHTAAQHERG